MHHFAALTRALIASMLSAVAGHAVAQQAYPSKPIRIIIPFPPGGSNDIVGRFLAQKLSEGFGVQTVIENRGGGNGIIGTEALLKAAPDGHTLMVTSVTTHLVTPLLMPTPYDAVRDFTAVATIDNSEFLLVVHPSLPVSTLQQFIALAKAKPGQLNYATSTTAGQLATAMFSMRTGITLQHIPYKGAGPALNDLLGGQVQMFFSTPSSMVAYVKGGKLKALGVTGDSRLSALPGVPTMAQGGLPDFDAAGFRGVLAPTGTPKAIVDRLAAEVARIVAMPDFRDRLVSQGMNPVVSTPEQMAARMKSDSARFAQIIKAANIKFEN